MRQGKAQEGDIIVRYVYLLNRQKGVVYQTIALVSPPISNAIYTGTLRHLANGL